MRQRHDILDEFRAALILLGIVLHAAAVYRPDAWLIADPQSHLIYGWINHSLHLFRMPALFFVAGLALQQNTSNKRLRDAICQRCVRLGLPLAVMVISVNVFITYLQVLCIESTQCRPPTIFSVDYIQHLWFLSDLLLFTVITLFAKRFLSRDQFKRQLKRIPLVILRKGNLLQAWLFKDSLNLTLGFACFTIAASMALLVIGIAYVRVGIGSNVLGLVVYGSFFTAGLLLGSKRFLHVLLNMRWTYKEFSIGIVLALICLLIKDETSILASVYYHVVRHLAAWFLIFSVFVLLRSLPLFLHQYLRKLSPYSYSIYLLHTACICFVAWALMHTSFNIHLKFLIVVVGSGALSIGLAKYMDAVPILRLLSTGNYTGPLVARKKPNPFSHPL